MISESELIELMEEIIISCQPLACATSVIRYRLNVEYGISFHDTSKIRKILKQERDRNPSLKCYKGGNTLFWRYDSGGILNG